MVDDPDNPWVDYDGCILWSTRCECAAQRAREEENPENYELHRRPFQARRVFAKPAKKGVEFSSRSSEDSENRGE